MADAKHTPAFTVAYEHHGFGHAIAFMTFRRTEKRQAFECLRRLSLAWPKTTYYLKRERKTIVRIERADIFDHLPRGHTTRLHAERFRAECAAIAKGAGSAA